MSSTAQTANTPRSGTPTSKKSKKARKSWFSLHRRAHNRVKNKDDAKANTKATAPPPSAFDQHQHLAQPDNRSGPLQFAPNRLATLYVTPSERNLYLAAMAQLDAPPQPLPLWADPAPQLPVLTQGMPMEPIMRAFSPPPASAPHPLTTGPMSPKLVTSPGLPGSGLQIREEFRSQAVRPTTTRHALISLVPNSFMRFTGFPPETILAIDRTLSENWPLGVWLRSEEMDDVRKRQGDEEGYTWRAELNGRAWKRKGSQELDSVRLLLALFTTLGVHGWSMVDSVQAAGLQKASHNLLFRHSHETQANPPAYFALSLPLPDRLSLISPPNKITPALLTAVRNAITLNSHLTSKAHSRSGTNATTGTTTTTSSNDSKRVTWGKEGQAKGIKLEGWVHPGVYRFWIAGMRRWLVGGVRANKVENLHPQLLMSLMSNMSSLGFDLAASVPLLPIAKGRDILYFSSTQASGLSYLDSFRPDATVAASSRSESPVFISPSESLGPSASAPNGLPAVPPALPPRKPQSPTAQTHATTSPDGQRVLPWTSILSDDPPSNPRQPSPERAAQTIQPPGQAFPPPSALPIEFSHRRTPSQDSSRPLIPPIAHPSPKQRNVLMKKNSLRRRSISRGSSVEMPAVIPPPSHAASTTIGTRTREATGGTSGSVEMDDGQWSMVDIPRRREQATEAKYGVEGTQDNSFGDGGRGVQVNDLMSDGRAERLSQATYGHRAEQSQDSTSDRRGEHASALTPDPRGSRGNGAVFDRRAQPTNDSTYEPILPPFHLHSPPPHPQAPITSSSRLPAPGAASYPTQPQQTRQDMPTTRPSFDSSGSVYEDTFETPMPVMPGAFEGENSQPNIYDQTLQTGSIPAPAASTRPLDALPRIGGISLQDGITAPAGSHVQSSTDPQPPLSPIRDQNPARRAGNAMVDVGPGIGIPSMHGSLGFFPNASERGSELSFGGAAPPVPPRPAQYEASLAGMGAATIPPKSVEPAGSAGPAGPAVPPKVGTARTRMTIE